MRSAILCAQAGGLILPRGIGGRLEVVGVKDPKLFISWASHAEHEGDVESGTLEIGDADAVHSRLELYLALFQARRSARRFRPR